MGHDPRNNPLHFGGDLNPEADQRISKIIFSTNCTDALQSPVPTLFLSVWSFHVLPLLVFRMGQMQRKNVDKACSALV